VLAILSALMAFASISTDLYLPAMPTISRAFGAGQGEMEVTISGYLAGFSLGQLFWGPVSDRYGRRLPVAAGVLLFIVGSAGCALASDAAMMIGWRVVQAVGASAGVVLARAMVRDLYPGERGAQMLSTLMTVMAIAPLIGPTVGGQLLGLGDWRLIFWVLVAVGVATVASLIGLPETFPQERRNRAPLSEALKGYAALLRDRRLLALAGTGGFFYAGTFAYIAGSPFAYIAHYHVPARYYGLLFGAGIVGIMIMNLVNARLVVRVGSLKLMRIGAGVAAAAGVALAICASTRLGGLVGLAAPMFLFVSVTGMIIANAVALAMSADASRAGAISALVGATQYGMGMLGSAVAGALADGTPAPFTWVVAISGLGCLLCACLAGRR
jgi:DHA1 family bicyclomycin/chloramphenicol resistance-like MFS transporter